VYADANSDGSEHAHKVSDAKARKRKQRLAQAKDLSFSPSALSAKERPRGF
jgi:hypothetical protein